MDKKTELKGMWWIKGNEESKFAGVLTYGDDYAPTLEIFPKEYDWDRQYVPNNSTIYGDVFWDSPKIKAVTLLECKSQKSFGFLDVGAFVYKHEIVFAECVAIGMLLDDDEIAQVKSPQNIYVTCPGLNEYSTAYTIDYVWKDNIPKGRAYRINDLDKIVYTQPDPISIEIDIGTITISLGQSSSARDISSRYSIQIRLLYPTPQAEVTSLIYSQWISFLSIITGRREHIESHTVAIDSNQTRSGSLDIELKYGHIAHSTQDTEYHIFQALLLGREENMNKFATLFPKWRENFASIEDLAFHYMRMADEPHEPNLLQAYPLIENYVLERVLKKPKKGMPGILSEVIHCIADHFSCSSVYSKHFPADQREHIVRQLANFRHNRIHPKSNKECVFSFNKVYAYIEVILRSIFLKEMEYSYDDIDNEINYWNLWRYIDGE